MSRHYCSENFATLCRQKFLNDHDLLINQDLRYSNSLLTHFVSDISVLTAFNRNATGVNGDPCLYTGVRGVYATIPAKKLRTLENSIRARDAIRSTLA